MSTVTVPRHGFAQIDDVWVAFADMAVLTALDAYGRRLLRHLGRSVRNNDRHLKALPPEQWHTVIKASDHRGPDASAKADILIDEMLNGALRLFDATAPKADPETAACLREAITTYLRTIIGAGLAHNPKKLAQMIYDVGCLETAAA